jgi:hypothetical protein
MKYYANEFKKSKRQEKLKSLLYFEEKIEITNSRFCYQLHPDATTTKFYEKFSH